MAAKISYYILKPEGRHKVEVFLVMALFVALALALTVHGFDYYRLAPMQRVFHPLHHELRSTGTIGIPLALLGVTVLGCIYLYAIRKRWKWLVKVGKTRNWLDVHVVMGIGAPLIIMSLRRRPLPPVQYRVKYHPWWDQLFHHRALYLQWR